MAIVAVGERCKELERPLEDGPHPGRVEVGLQQRGRREDRHGDQCEGDSENEDDEVREHLPPPAPLDQELARRLPAVLADERVDVPGGQRALLARELDGLAAGDVLEHALRDEPALPGVEALLLVAHLHEEGRARLRNPLLVLKVLGAPAVGQPRLLAGPVLREEDHPQQGPRAVHQRPQVVHGAGAKPANDRRNAEKPKRQQRRGQKLQKGKVERHLLAKIVAHLVEPSQRRVAAAPHRVLTPPALCALQAHRVRGGGCGCGCGCGCGGVSGGGGGVGGGGAVATGGGQAGVVVGYQLARAADRQGVLDARRQAGEHSDACQPEPAYPAQRAEPMDPTIFAVEAEELPARVLIVQRDDPDQSALLVFLQPQSRPLEPHHLLLSFPLLLREAPHAPPRRALRLRVPIHVLAVGGHVATVLAGRRPVFGIGGQDVKDDLQALQRRVLELLLAVLPQGCCRGRAARAGLAGTGGEVGVVELPRVDLVGVAIARQPLL